MKIKHKRLKTHNIYAATHPRLLILSQSAWLMIYSAITILIIFEITNSKVVSDAMVSSVKIFKTV
jgi:hypothetical protein